MKSDLQVACDAVQEAGIALAQAFGRVESLRNKSASAASVVTQFDIDAEALIEKRLKEHNSTIGFVGEESGERKGDGKFWLLDPIDGTAHFVRGIPFCTTMLALVENGQVTLSVIYNFVTKELFTAEKGGGAKLNGNYIQVSNRGLEDAYLVIESDLNNEINLSRFLALKNKATVLQTINCGYEFGLIATGKLEGRLCFSPFGEDWDYAPGSLLVSEAGGVVTNVGKKTYDYTNHDFLAANQVVYKDLTEGPNAIFPTQ